MGNDVGGLLAGQFFQVRFCVVQIGEDLGHGIHAQNGIELLALVGRQGCEGVGKVVLVVIRELFGQLCLRQAAVDEGEYFLLVVLLLHLGFLLPFWGHKNTPRRLLVRLLRCIMGRCIQDAADSIHTARIAGGALFGVV